MLSDRECSGIWIICKTILFLCSCTSLPGHVSSLDSLVIIAFNTRVGLPIDNLAGSIAHNSRSGLMWNIALDGNGGPKLPGTNSCGGPGCRGIVQVDLDGSYTINQECKALYCRVVGTAMTLVRLCYGTCFQSHHSQGPEWSFRSTYESGC